MASSSPRRRALLREAGIPFRAVSVPVREVNVLWDGKGPRRTPRQVVLHNARLKARSVARRFPHQWVLGADTVVVLGEKLLGKPRDFSEAESMLTALCGRTHRVITGICLQRGEETVCLAAVATEVTFKHLTRSRIRTYLKRIHPLDKAGAYAAQEYGDRIIKRVKGSWTNVVGLPMDRLLRELGRIKEKGSR